MATLLLFHGELAGILSPHCQQIPQKDQTWANMVQITQTQSKLMHCDPLSDTVTLHIVNTQPLQS